MSNYDNHINLGLGQVLTPPSPPSSGTSLVLLTGQGSLFSAAPFNCTAWPAGASIPTVGNSEIIRVTAISGDTLTIVRQQEGSNLQAITNGWNIENTITVKVLTDIEKGGSVTPNTVTVVSNAGTCLASYRVNTFTNSSAATMALTLSTLGATDGQSMIVRVYDFSAAAQTIGWTNTENSTVSVPITSNGSTTHPLTVGFIFNSSTSYWRCVAVS